MLFGAKKSSSLLGAIIHVASSYIPIRRPGQNMRYFTGLVILFAWLGTAHALTPPLDNSPGFFSGEWAGTGNQGAYCYLKLSTNGWGWVLVDGGAGDWLGARIQWRNRQQSLQIEKIVPLHASTQLRVMPLGQFVLSGGFNQSLRLTWNEQSGDCHLQMIETTARHLLRARKAIESLLPGESMR
jgi:hypothetical protein